ncbi:Type II secretion system protein K [Nymphon striatum]|nr:Type II secretion system protein K [Nymphon striatum]
MIITSIAVSLAGMIMYRQQVQIRLSSNIGHFEQAYLYANGMEDWAGKILEKNFEDQPDYDSLSDPWNNEGNDIVLPITGGLMTGKLHDLQARINLNSLNRPKTTTNNLSTATVASLVPGNSSNNNEDESQEEDEENEKKKYFYPAEVTRERLVNLLSIEIDPEQEIRILQKTLPICLKIGLM